MSKLFRVKPPYPALLKQYGVRENQVTAPRVLEALYKISNDSRHCKQVAEKFVKWAEHHNRHFSKPDMDKIKSIAQYDYDFMKDDVFSNIHRSLTSLQSHANYLNLADKNDGARFGFVFGMNRTDSANTAAYKSLVLQNLLKRFNNQISLYTSQMLNAFLHHETQNPKEIKVKLVDRLLDVVNNMSPFDRDTIEQHRGNFSMFNMTRSAGLLSNTIAAIEIAKSKLQSEPELISAYTNRR